MYNITKESLEDFLGYELDDYEVEPVYHDDECIGVNIEVQPRLFITKIETSIKTPTGQLYPMNID